MKRTERVLIFYQSLENSDLFRCAERPDVWLTMDECNKIEAGAHVFVVSDHSELAREAAEPESGKYITHNG